MRYLDSASRDPRQTGHSWMQSSLRGATAFAAQSGYFRFDALVPFKQDIERLLHRGGTFDLVIGANEDVVRAPDLEDTLGLLKPWLGNGATFTLVAARDALFHPKTVYIEGPGRRRAALVGSGNLTSSGLRNNVEAALTLDEHDDPTVLDAIRDAIRAWPASAAPGASAQPITEQLVDALTADGSMLPSRIPLGASAGNPRSRFPSLGRIPEMPVAGRPLRPRTTPPVARLGRRTSSFPSGTTGIVKRLSQTDIKGFAGRMGTPYIALPSLLAAQLPMRMSGTNSEPRIDLAVEARLDRALRHIVASGHQAGNVQHVGSGSRRRSHRDLRLNVGKHVWRQLAGVAATTRASLPAQGDIAAIEFLDGGRLVRLTFAAHDPLRTVLLGQLHPRKPWGWLAAGLVPSW